MDAELSSLDVVPRDLLVGLDAVQLDAALAQALADGIEPAVYALVSLMDDPAVASTLLASPPDQTPPLVQSLSHPNPRIRWMAARTLAQLDPYGKFSGASRVVDNLTFAARTRGVSRAVVAHPNRSMGQRLAGMLASRGFQATTVTTSTDLLAAATASPDVELLLISNSMNEWTWWSLVEELRANPLTAGLPILVLARPDAVDKARVLADKQERLMLVSESLTEEDLQLQLPRILATAAEYRIDRERRFAMATDALKSLAGLLTDGRRLNVELLGDDAALLMGLDVPDLMEAATDVLVTLPEPVAQLALADTANQLARPITERQRAARGFAESVKRNGLLLSSAQVGQQYERYNQSRTLDPDTQQVLGTILDSIEQTE
jgi:CheY-like chemotaxis protein